MNKKAKIRNCFDVYSIDTTILISAIILFVLFKKNLSKSYYFAINGSSSLKSRVLFSFQLFLDLNTHYNFRWTSFIEIG